jgi:hypothetical protein
VVEGKIRREDFIDLTVNRIGMRKDVVVVPLAEPHRTKTGEPHQHPHHHNPEKVGMSLATNNGPIITLPNWAGPRNHGNHCPTGPLMMGAMAEELIDLQWEDLMIKEDILKLKGMKVVT